MKVPTLPNFRKKLALALMDNEFIGEVDPEERRGSKQRQRDTEVHVLASVLPFAKTWKGKKWDCSAKAKYQQYTCQGHGCSHKVFTYCACGVGYWMCKSCHMTHLVEEVTSKGSSN